MSKKLHLSGRLGSVIGNYALVDDDIYEELNKWKWYAYRSPRSLSIYVARGSGKNRIILHRYILNTTDPNIFVDHINHDTLDARKINLREVSKQENTWNTISHRDSLCPYKGVVKTKSNKYRVEIMKSGIKYNLGVYLSIEDAAEVYDRKAIELFGEFACLNFPEKDYSTSNIPQNSARSSKTGYKNIHTTTNPNYKYRAEIVIKGKTYTKLCNSIEDGESFLKNTKEKYD